MKRNSTLIAPALFSASGTWAGELPKNTLKVTDVEEIVVTAAPEENRKLREPPTAITMSSWQDMQVNQVNSIKSLAAPVSNIFTPDHGSRLTPATYIHGIGSCINTPSVGLYVDNVPYTDKSAFDFNYAGIERADALRGPWGTLYGRNTAGGLIKAYTKSLFSYQGTDPRLGAGSCGNYNASVTHYRRILNQFASSAGGFYEYGGGFFRNTYLSKRIDKSQAAGGRLRGIYLSGENLKLDSNISHEYGHEGGYLYFYTGRADPAGREDDPRKERIGKISYNDESTYRRGLLDAGINIEYQAQKFILSAVTGFQDLDNRMFPDQDFTEKNLLNLIQKQKLNTLSEGVMPKSKPGSNR